jgi:hypothetical protein
MATPATVTKLARRSKKTKTQSEPQYRTVGAWTPSKVESAKRLADHGNLEYAADLAEKIFGDDRALSPLQALAGIAGLEVTFESEATKAGKEDPQVEALERDWWHLLPEDTQGEILRWSSVLGYCWAQIKEWVLDDESGRLLPVLDVWHQKNFRWDDLRRTWKAKTAGGNWADIQSGDGEWILFTPYGKKRPWSKAPWYSLGMLWLGTQYAKLGLFEFNDNSAQPLRVASQRPTSADGLVSLPEPGDVDDLTTKIASLVRGGSIALPNGYELQLLSAAGDGASFFRLIDEVWPKSVSISLTGNNLTTQIDGGSFAASETAVGVKQDCKRTFARCLETTAREQLLVWWSEFNFGNRLAPWPHYGIEPPKDRKMLAEGLLIGLQAVAEAKAMGLKLSKDRMAELLGDGIEEDPDFEPPPPPQAPPPTPPPGNEDGDNESQPDDDEEQDDEPRAMAQLDLTREVIQETRATKADDEADKFDDQLIARATKAARQAVGVEDILEIIAAVDADDPNPEERLERVRREVLHRFSNLDPAAFVDAVERSEILASLNGRYAAIRGW